MNDLSRQKRRPSLALMEHLMPFMLWWLRISYSVRKALGKQGGIEEWIADLKKSFDGVIIFFPERPLKTREMT